MARLPRPTIPIEIKCRVVLLQIGEMYSGEVIGAHKRRLGALLAEKLRDLSALLRCQVDDLRLDHDPPLGARRKVFDGVGKHVEYDPPANSIEHLRYRPHGTTHAGSHDVKTRVRGDHGQLSDIALVKRNRRQEEREGTRPKSAKTRMRERRAAARDARKKSVRRKASKLHKGPKRKWPKRKFQSRRKPNARDRA